MTDRRGVVLHIDDIRPPRYVPGMEKALPDYSERLQRRTGTSASLVSVKYDTVQERVDVCT